MLSRSHKLIVWILLVAGGLIPIGLYWLRMGRVPTITPPEARALLAEPNDRAVLVDVRTPAEYGQGHLEQAILWPLDEIRRGGQPPEALRGRPLLVLCRSGFRSVEATRTLRAAGYDATNIRGGMQEWIAFAPAMCTAGSLAPRAGMEGGSGLPFREASAFEQWTAVVTAFGIKPAYMLAALVIAWVLRRSRWLDLVALRWAMLAFFAGEMFCQLNYLLFNERSHLFEFLHSYGMAVAFALTTFAAIEFFDLRLIHYSDPAGRCAGTGLCHGCIKHSQTTCLMRRLFQVLIPAAALLAALPLFAPYHANAYNTRIFGTVYSYVHPVIHQVYEIRLLPVMAIVLLAGAWGVLLRERHPAALSKILFCAALGAMGYSYFRMVLLAPFADNQAWFAAWEELTEMLYIALVAGGLWILRWPLLAARNHREDGAISRSAADHPL